MSKRTIFCRRDPLGDRLRRESWETRPAFSEALYQRIVAALQEQCPHRRAKPRAEPWPWRPSKVGQLGGRPTQQGHRAATSRERLVWATSMVTTAGVWLVMLGIGWRGTGWLPSVRHWQPVHVTIAHRSADAASRRDVEAALAACMPQKSSDTPLVRSPARERPATSQPAGPARPNAARPQLAQLAAGAAFDCLVCDDARRAARVLFNRLPIDLSLADLTQPDR